MGIDFLALATFVLVTTFTPGPNNISSASMGILHGYKKTLRYLVGIGVGFFLVMLLCSWVSATLLQIFPVIESFLRVIGAFYILWLALHTLKASYSFSEEDQILMGFSKGFFLQILNPKAIIYGLTLYSTFLAAMTENLLFSFISALIFAGVAFMAISTWTLFGASIRTYINRPWVKQVLNTILSLLLVYTAVELSGILELLFS